MQKKKIDLIYGGGQSSAVSVERVVETQSM